MNGIDTTNYCHEIELTERTPVEPWFQVSLMNHFRVKSGKPPFTLEECKQIEAELTKQLQEE